MVGADVVGMMGDCVVWSCVKVCDDDVVVVGVAVQDLRECEVVAEVGRG